MTDDLPLPRIGPNAVHLCVDMQVMFAAHTDWHMPWMPRVLPRVAELARAHPGATVFTRFIPAAAVGEGRGTWRGYYERWPGMTQERLPPGAIDLVPELARLSPPAVVYDKRVYSPWDGDLDLRLQHRGIDTLVVSGGETEVCVLASVLGAVDRGYRVVVATDALCSSSDSTHDAAIDLFHRRYGSQVETATVAAILAAWSNVAAGL